MNHANTIGIFNLQRIFDKILFRKPNKNIVNKHNLTKQQILMPCFVLYRFHIMF